MRMDRSSAMTWPAPDPTKVKIRAPRPPAPRLSDHMHYERWLSGEEYRTWWWRTFGRSLG